MTPLEQALERLKAQMSWTPIGVDESRKTMSLHMSQGEVEALKLAAAAIIALRRTW